MNHVLELMLAILTSVITILELVLRLVPGKKRGSLFSRAGKIAAKRSGVRAQKFSAAMFKLSDGISKLVPDRESKEPSE